MSVQRVTTMAGASAGGALLCAICCVAPFALPAATLAGLGGALAWIGRMHAGVSLFATGMVALAWAWVIVASLRSRRRPAASTWIALGAATLVLGAALTFPLFEPHIVAALTGGEVGLGGR